VRTSFKKNALVGFKEFVVKMLYCFFVYRCCMLSY